MKKIIALLMTFFVSMSAMAVQITAYAADVILGDFPMEAADSRVQMQQGATESNYVAHTEEGRTGKYLKANGANGTTRCFLSESLSGGAFTVEYEVNATSTSSISIGNTEDNNRSITLFSGLGEAGVWSKFKVSVIMTPGLANDSIYAVLYDENGEKLNEINTVTQAKVWNSSLGKDEYFNFHGINYVGFFSGWSGKTHSLDNVKITRTPPTVTKVHFVDGDGSYRENYGDLTDKLSGIALTFTTEMDENSITAELESSLGTDICAVGKSGGKIIVTPSNGQFSVNEDYKLTIKRGAMDIYELELEEDFFFEFNTQKAYKNAVFGDFPMEGPSDRVKMQGGNNEQNYPVHTEAGRTGKYLKAQGSNGVTRCFVDEEISYGSFEVDFEINPSVTGSISIGNTNDNSRSITLFSGIGTAGEWTKYKVAVDLLPGAENDTVKSVLYDENGEKIDEINTVTQAKVWNSSLGVDEYFDFHGINFIGFFSGWNGGQTHSVDNVKVTYANPCFDKVSFTDFEGNKTDKLNELPGLLKSVDFMFSNDIDSESASPELYNITKGEYEDFDYEINGRAISIYPKQGYFTPDSEYEASFPYGIIDLYGNEIYDDVSATFFNQGAGMGISGLKILKDGEEADLSDISAGDSVELSFEYIFVDGSKENLILALVTRKDGKITGFTHRAVEVSGIGKNSVELSYTLSPDLEFDSIQGFVWDKNSRLPLMDELVLE